MPTVYQAFRVHGDPHGAGRSALEARVLAGEAPHAIAAKGATPAAVVTLYELLFFDVRGRLGSPDYVLTRVLEPRLRGAGWDDGLAWMFFGYFGGPHVLDELLGAGGGAARPAGRRQAEAFLAGDARAVLRRQLAVAARALRAGDPAAAAALVRAAARPPGGEDEAPPNALEAHVEAMLREIPWTVAGRDAEELPPKLAEYEGTAAELRADEEFLLAAGQEPAGLADLKGLTLPPPRPGGAGALPPR
jgi:hypothetical protein